ncbi:MAG: ATP-binding protein [Parvularculaceae bacterium]
MQSTAGRRPAKLSPPAAIGAAVLAGAGLAGAVAAPQWNLLWGAAIAAAGAIAIWLWRARASAKADALALRDVGDGARRMVRSVLSVFPEPILIVGDDGRIVLANAAAQSFAQVSPEDRPLTSVLREPAVLTAVDDVRAGMPEHSVDFNPPGAVERNWRALVAPMGDPEDEGLVAIVLRDLTSERRLERMRADFIASASHELRTPLASLQGFIETLRGHAREDPAAQERFLEIMDDQAQRMGRLVDDLMSLSRIELNEHVPPHGETELVAAAGDVLAGLKPVADAAGAELVVKEDSPAPMPVVGDRDEIIQVVQNLVDNAIKYGGDRGPVEIAIGRGAPPAFVAKNGAAAYRSGDAVGQIAAREGLTEKDFCYVRVRDFGEGISRTDLPRLTERFYRVDVERSRRRGGTGLGLAIVKHILNRHRGGLQVESVVGEGSAFTAFFRGAAPGE